MDICTLLTLTLAVAVAVALVSAATPSPPNTSTQDWALVFQWPEANLTSKHTLQAELAPSHLAEMGAQAH